MFGLASVRARPCSSSAWKIVRNWKSPLVLMYLAKPSTAGPRSGGSDGDSILPVNRPPAIAPSRCLAERM